MTKHEGSEICNGICQAPLLPAADLPAAASTHAAPKPASREDITFTENSWKEFISKDHDPAWTNGTDELTAAGFDMLPMEGGKMGDYMRGPIETQLGPMWMNSFPPLVKEDFYQQYHQPTFWPYCESLERCIVYSQNESAAALYPVSMRLPPGVGAIDFYLDLAIDCVNTTSVTMPCFVMTDPPAHDPFVIIKNVSSICASAKVGQYFGFYNHAGGSISQIRLNCRGSYSRVIGLIRLGKQLARVEQHRPIADV